MLTTHASRVFGNKLDNFGQQLCPNQHVLLSVVSNSTMTRYLVFDATVISLFLCISPRTYHLVLDRYDPRLLQTVVRAKHESAMLNLSYQGTRTSSICSCNAGSQETDVEQGRRVSDQDHAMLIRPGSVRATVLSRQTTPS